MLELNDDGVLEKVDEEKLVTVDEEELDELINRHNELQQFKDKVFALIDARIAIHQHKPFMAPVSAPLSVNFDEDSDRLARLSELEQLKKELSE